MSATPASLLASLLTLGALDKVSISLILIVSGAFIIAWPLLPRVAGRFRRAAPPPQTVQERAERAAAASRDRTALDDLASDVREVSRLCAAQLDARVRRVEDLLERANGTIARLEALVASAGESPAEGPQAGSLGGVREPADPAWTLAQAPEVMVRHVRPGPAVAPAAAPQSLAVAVGGDGHTWPGQVGRGHPEAADPLTHQICDLAATGLSAVEIAARLEEHVGKVELILALQRR